MFIKWFETNNHGPKDFSTKGTYYTLDQLKPDNLAEWPTIKILLNNENLDYLELNSNQHIQKMGYNSKNEILYHFDVSLLGSNNNIGNGLMQHYYTVFNIEHNQISFYKINN